MEINEIDLNDFVDNDLRELRSLIEETLQARATARQDKAYDNLVKAFKEYQAVAGRNSSIHVNITYYDQDSEFYRNVDGALSYTDDAFQAVETT